MMKKAIWVVLICGIGFSGCMRMAAREEALRAEAERARAEAARAAATADAASMPRESLVPARPEGTTLRVVSFNILYAGRKDHPWRERREAAIAHLRDLAPDIFGVQEAEWSQVQDLADAFPRYVAVGRGRDDGLTAGEAMAVYYRRDRFVLQSAETFWLSDTPEIPGSNTWGAACNRTGTIAILTDRTNGKPLGVCNTHLDHVSANAREKGSALIRERLAAYGDDLAWVVTGDFNSRPGSKPYENLVGQGLLDTFAGVEPFAPLGPSTFHGYAGQPRENSRIDWILATPQFEVLATGIGQVKYGGMFPSDHFSVWADLKRAE